MMATIKLDDGKYEFDLDDQTGLMMAARRHGEPWEAGFEQRFSKAFMSALSRIRDLEAPAQPVKEPYSTEWWLADVDAAGNLERLSDGAHSERAGADKAAYLHAALGLKHDRKFAVARVDLFEARPSSTGVNHQAVAACRTMAAVVAKGDEQ